MDLLEQNSAFVEKAMDLLSDSKKARNFFCSGLQDFKFDENIKYDVVWVQWVTGYLTDDHLCTFLRNCASALAENGIIVVKDNNTAKGFYVDDQDKSVTR